NTDSMNPANMLGQSQPKSSPPGLSIRPSNTTSGITKAEGRIMFADWVMERNEKFNAPISSCGRGHPWRFWSARILAENTYQAIQDTGACDTQYLRHDKGINDFP